MIIFVYSLEMQCEQHIFKTIIRRSVFLMNNTDKSIKEISDSLNFPNPSAFGTFFKKHTAASPRLFSENYCLRPK